MARTLPVVILFTTQFVLPAWLGYSLWRRHDGSRMAWWLRAAYSSVYVLLVVLVGRWDWVGYALRFAVPFAFAVAAITGYRRMSCRPPTPRAARTSWETLSAVATLGLFLMALWSTVRGFGYPEAPVQMRSPLDDGEYYVAQGGSSTLINYHHRSRSQRFALDIVALNALGTRAAGLYPRALQDYEIFGRPVRSPCDGTVIEAVDGLPDLPPPQRDADNPAGNHIVIRCGDARVELAHLQNGSLHVSRGARVGVGAPLALVGNSGNTSEPHLHIHAVGGTANAQVTGVPMLIDGVYAVRNTILP